MQTQIEKARYSVLMALCDVGNAVTQRQFCELVRHLYSAETVQEVQAVTPARLRDAALRRFRDLPVEKSVLIQAAQLADDDT